MNDTLMMGLMALVPMILSLTVHEFAHAWAAKRMGDDTAESVGRLTLNPLAHADPIGTFLLPLVTMGAGGFFFGWAKPVPFNPTRFRPGVNIRRAITFVAAAGPLSNLALAVICTAVIAVMAHSGLWSDDPSATQTLLERMMLVNVSLFVFNMVPIAPLDGQKVLSGFLPSPVALQFERFNYRFGWLALMGVILLGGSILGVPHQLITHGLLSAFGLG